MDLLCFCSVLCLLCLCARLFICALWSPAGKGLTSWLSFVVSAVSLSLSHWYPGSGVVLTFTMCWCVKYFVHISFFFLNRQLSVCQGYFFMYLYRVLAGTFSQVQLRQDVGISNDRFGQFLLYHALLVIYEKAAKFETVVYCKL